MKQEGRLPHLASLPFADDAAAEIDDLRKRLVLEETRTSNLRNHLASEGYSPEDITAVQDTGERQIDLARTMKEAKWIRNVLGWLKKHGWGRDGLGLGAQPNCYLLLLYKQVRGFLMTFRDGPPQDILAPERSNANCDKSLFEWRIYVGSAQKDPRPYREDLKKHKVLTHAPGCVKAWCAAGFRYLGEYELKSCPDGLEDALTLLLSMAFARYGQGNWVQPAPWNPHGAPLDCYFNAVQGTLQKALDTLKYSSKSIKHSKTLNTKQWTLFGMQINSPCAHANSRLQC